MARDAAQARPAGQQLPRLTRPRVTALQRLQGPHSDGEGGKIAEQWDVMQDETEKAANDNTTI